MLVMKATGMELPDSRYQIAFRATTTEAEKAVSDSKTSTGHQNYPKDSYILFVIFAISMLL